MTFNKELYWERRRSGERGANQGIEAHPNYVKPYGIVTRELTTRQPWKNPYKRPRMKKKERKLLRRV